MASQIGNSGLLAGKANTLYNHINGISNKHDGYDIVLDPPIEINSTNHSDVYSAIENLVTYTSGLVVDASASNKGIIKLTNDLGGTANSPNVVKITGSSNQINIDPRNLAFTSTNSGTDVEFKYANTASSAKGINITAQHITNSPFNINPGGNVTISSGSKSFSNSLSRDGKIFLNVGVVNMLTAKHLTLSSRIISLFKEATSSDIPGEANKTVFISDTVSDPSLNPINGSHIYSKSGKVRIKNANGDNFNLGDNPSQWYSSTINNGLIHKVSTATSNLAIVSMFSFAMPTTDCVVMVEVDIVGKRPGTVSNVAYKMIGHFYSNGSLTPVEVGTETNVYSSTNSAPWTAPSIAVSGSNIVVRSGVLIGQNINWTAYCKLTINSV